MNIKEIKEKAKTVGISNAEKMKKVDVIRAIQAKEGNFPCFQTAQDFCDQNSCCWRSDCVH